MNPTNISPSLVSMKIVLVIVLSISGHMRCQESTQSKTKKLSLPDLAALASIPRVPNFFIEEKLSKLLMFNQWCYFEERGPWLVSVDRTHLVLVSGNLGVQKD